MCRKKTLQGCCCLCFGIGLMVGYGLESWLLCSMGGFALVICGIFITRQR